MTIGIKTAANDVYVLTAVTAYTGSYSSKITDHPVEGRKNITDHVITNQPVFRISGIVTALDLLGSPEELQVFAESLFSADENSTTQAYYIGAEAVPSDSVVISSQPESRFSNLVPEAFSNLVQGDVASVEMASTASRITLLSFKQALLDIKDSAKVVSLLLFDDNKVAEVIQDCLIESISCEENPETGDALDLDITLRRVSFVTLGSTTVPTLTWKEIDLSSKKDGSKGTQQGDGYGGQSPTSTKPAPGAVVAFDSCQADFGQRSPINCLVKQILGSGFDFFGGT